MRTRIHFPLSGAHKLVGTTGWITQRGARKLNMLGIYMFLYNAFVPLMSICHVWN
jgi:hypothetical protein